MGKAGPCFENHFMLISMLIVFQKVLRFNGCGIGERIQLREKKSFIRNASQSIKHTIWYLKISLNFHTPPNLTEAEMKSGRGEKGEEFCLANQPTLPGFAI